MPVGGDGDHLVGRRGSVDDEGEWAAVRVGVALLDAVLELLRAAAFEQEDQEGVALLVGGPLAGDVFEDVGARLDGGRRRPGLEVGVGVDPVVVGLAPDALGSDRRR